MYHTTPHLITYINPAEVMFNRKLNDKFPSLRDHLKLSEVRDRIMK